MALRWGVLLDVTAPNEAGEVRRPQQGGHQALLPRIDGAQERDRDPADDRHAECCGVAEPPALLVEKKVAHVVEPRKPDEQNKVQPDSDSRLDGQIKLQAAHDLVPECTAAQCTHERAEPQAGEHPLVV